MTGALGHVFTLVWAINAARDAGVSREPFVQAQAASRQLTRVLRMELQEEEGKGKGVAPFRKAVERPFGPSAG